MTHIRVGLVLVQSIKLILTNTFSLPAYTAVAFKYGIIRLDMVQLDSFNIYIYQPCKP